MSHNQIGTVNGDGTFNPYGSTVGDTVSANNVTYDNTSSGLTATDAQEAIDEVDSNTSKLRASGTTNAAMYSAITAFTSNATHRQIANAVLLVKDKTSGYGFTSRLTCASSNTVFRTGGYMGMRMVFCGKYLLQMQYLRNR